MAGKAYLLWVICSATLLSGCSQPIHVVIDRSIRDEAIEESRLIDEKIKDLNSAAIIYTADNAQTPDSFLQLATMDLSRRKAQRKSLVSFRKFGANYKTSPCKIMPQEIDCSNAFRHYKDVKFHLVEGSFEVSGEPIDGGPEVE